MTEKEIRHCIEHIQLLGDNREHKTDEFIARCSRLKELSGSSVKLTTINAGDYSARTWDMQGNEIDLREIVVVERKQSLDELATNLTKEKERFEREFTRAKDKGTKVYLLVENMSFTKLFNGTMPNHPFINKNSVLGAFFSFVARYRLQVLFCKPSQTADIIYHVMCKELEEYLNPKDAHRFEDKKNDKSV